MANRGFGLIGVPNHGFRLAVGLGGQPKTKKREKKDHILVKYHKKTSLYMREKNADIIVIKKAIFFSKLPKYIGLFCKNVIEFYSVILTTRSKK